MLSLSGVVSTNKTEQKTEDELARFLRNMVKEEKLKYEDGMFKKK